MSLTKVVNKLRQPNKGPMMRKKDLIQLGILKSVCAAGAVKISLMLLAGLLSTRPLPAQSFSEWFRQKKTQKKYLLAQIAGLKSYRHWIEKGYQAAADGLSTVSAFKKGDFSQHSRYFSGWENVRSAVKNYPKVPAILQMEAAMSKIRAKLTAPMDSELAVILNSQERQSLQRINDAAAADADKELELLTLLMTDGKLKMTTDERINAINRLYSRVRKRLTATMTFDRSMQALTGSRKKQAAATGEMRVLRRLYGE